MKETAKILHVASTALLAVGYLGLALFVWDTNFGSGDGGASIGLGVIALLCLVAGALGVVAAMTSAVLFLATRKDKPSPARIEQ